MCSEPCQKGTKDQEVRTIHDTLNGTPGEQDDNAQKNTWVTWDTRYLCPPFMKLHSGHIDSGPKCP